ncbi:MAG: hypothetical protein R3E39_06790 [Anaerolineae bacterium]
MLTDRDYELLSAYIDDALLPTERTELETRFKAEIELREELDAIRSTVSLLNELPVIKPPRNLTLPVGFTRRPTRWLFFPTSTAFSGLSVAAAILLIVVSSMLFTRTNSPLSLPSGGAAMSEQQLAFSPTEAIIESQKASDEAPSSNTATIPPPVTNESDGLLAETSLPSTDAFAAPNLAPSVVQESPAQDANILPAPTQTALQFYAASAPTNASSSASANLENNVATTPIPEVGLSASELAQAEQSGGESADTVNDAISQAANNNAPSDNTNMARAASPTAVLTATALPTRVVVQPPQPEIDTRDRVQEAPSNLLPIILMASGLVLFLIAIGTTIVRRRNS